MTLCSRRDELRNWMPSQRLVLSDLTERDQPYEFFLKACATVDPDRSYRAHNREHHTSVYEQSKFLNRQMRVAARTPFEPPAWLSDPSLLPKKPPCRTGEGT